MKERQLKIFFLFANTLLLAGFYLLLGWTYFHKKRGISISLIQDREVAQALTFSSPRKRRDEFLVIEKTFGLRRPAPIKPISSPPPARERKPLPPKISLRLILYSEETPNQSRVWVLLPGGNIQVVAVGESFQGYVLEKIERQVKGKFKNKTEVVYQVVFRKGKEKITIPFTTWEVK